MCKLRSNWNMEKLAATTATKKLKKRKKKVAKQTNKS